MPKNKNAFQMGLGCLDLTRENNDIIDEAIKCGVTYFDTSDCYGLNYESEVALGEKIARYPRETLFISTKTGVYFDEDGIHVNGSPAYLKRACQDSLSRLKTTYIDLYYLHRIDPALPIEISMHAMKSLVEAGLIRGIGLSEVSPEQIRSAHQIHPISAVQIEYAPWSRDDEVNGVVETCRALGISVVAYSPLGRGFFTENKEAYFLNMPNNDFRKSLPRYRGKNLRLNQVQKKEIENFANNKNVTVAQLVLAWEMAKGYVVIPGTVNVQHFHENYRALNVVLSDEDCLALDRVISNSNYHGLRYPDNQKSGIFTLGDELKQSYSCRLFQQLTLVSSADTTEVKKLGSSRGRSVSI